MKRYEPKKVESKWQKYWDEHQTYKADMNSSKPKYYAMSMLNYPSGSGIHIGHAMNYTISDVMARFKRQQGFESYHPVGWDSFGLPAENYAIKTGLSPQASLKKIIPLYHKQYKAMGWSNDWSKEISTHEPEYYKWTQWIFSEMFRQGLAYQGTRMQWWCPLDNSVLADEQVTPEGKCWRHDGPNDPIVEKKPVKQWFFKITDYADELLEATDDLEWTESVKLAQKNWIGKSVGAEIDFPVVIPDSDRESSNKKMDPRVKPEDDVSRIKVFTTRPDTIFGATYLVLAPEHPLVEKLTAKGHQLAVKEYVDMAVRKSELERQEGGKEKTGVFTGAHAINPANQEKIPIWIADYVLTGYGTGAIMAVPAHDERDYEFAKRFELPIREVIKPSEAQNDSNIYTGEGLLINSGQYVGMDSAEAREIIVKNLSGMDSTNEARIEYFFNAETEEEEPVFVDLTKQSTPKPELPYVERQAITALVKHWKEDKYIGLKWKKVDWETLITGGIETGQTAEEAAIEEIRQETGYKNPVLKKKFQNMHAKFYHNPKGENRYAHFTCLYFELADDEKEEIDETEQGNHQVLWLTKDQMEEFRLPDSQRFMWNLFLDKPSLARPKTIYRMRDWSVSRQRYWGAPIPIIHCPDHGPVLVPDKDLPVVLPEIKDFAPKGDGRSALARAGDWLKAPCPTCGKMGERETDTLDTYICSSWYFLRYLDPHNDKQIFDSDIANHWMPLDFYNGADHATAHMIYARFVTRFFQKNGLVKEAEPFKKFLFNGKITAQDGKNFSKTKGNGPDPLDIIGSGYGADALRMYLMFAAPLDVWVRWDPQGVPGTYRFLTRLWGLVQEFMGAGKSSHKDDGLVGPTHRAIKKVTDDLEQQKYNTAIAAMMGLTNQLYKFKSDQPMVQSDNWRFALESLVQMVAPFAPHIADEMWQDLGHKTTVNVDNWPESDEKLARSEKLTIAVQVNGKLRGEVEIDADTDEAGIIKVAKADPKVTEHLKGQKIKKQIYVAGRLVNFVI